MQYEISLPADYDMAIIHQRVATRGHALDHLPGLGMKAYCIRERGVDGALANEYAPFYIWSRSEAMNAFLWGAGFQGLCDSFGRPRVRRWSGTVFRPGRAIDAVPVAATRELTLIGRDEVLRDVIARADDESRALASDPALHSTAVAIDPERWELVRFSAWTEARPTGSGTLYTVAHVSAPSLAELSSEQARVFPTADGLT